MSELIQVDFKQGIITARRDLDEPVPAWVARKDPAFKDWVAGIAMLAEAAHAYGGDWRKMCVIMGDKPAGAEPFCMTMWDNLAVPRDEVIDNLHLAIEKIINEPDDVQVLDAATVVPFPTEDEPDDQ